MHFVALGGFLLRRIYLGTVLVLSAWLRRSRGMASQTLTKLTQTISRALVELRRLSGPRLRITDIWHLWRDLTKNHSAARRRKQQAAEGFWSGAWRLASNKEVAVANHAGAQASAKGGGGCAAGCRQLAVACFRPVGG